MNVMLMRMRMATSWPASSWGLLPARHACRLYRRPGPRPHLARAPQVLVDRRGCADDRQMAELGPGALLQVSGVVGRG